jgi:acetoin utilization protein AcuB
VVEDGAIIGIVTWTDLVRIRPPALGGRWTMPNVAVAATVRHLMTTDPITADPEMSVEDAAAIMRRRKIGGLPVVDRRRVVGIVTESDLFKFFVEAFTAGSEEARLHLPVEQVAAELPRVISVLTEASIPVMSISTIRRKGHEAIDVVVRKRDAARARKALGQPVVDETRAESSERTLVFE